MFGLQFAQAQPGPLADRRIGKCRRAQRPADNSAHSETVGAGSKMPVATPKRERRSWVGGSRDSPRPAASPKRSATSALTEPSAARCENQQTHRLAAAGSRGQDGARVGDEAALRPQAVCADLAAELRSSGDRAALTRVARSLVRGSLDLVAADCLEPRATG